MITLEELIVIVVITGAIALGTAQWNSGVDTKEVITVERFEE